MRRGQFIQSHRGPPQRHPTSFRDYAAERTHTPHAVMQAALAHVVRNKAEAAYARSDLFEKRLALMESWAHYRALPWAEVGAAWDEIDFAAREWHIPA